jgi:hypothetical protein
MHLKRFLFSYALILFIVLFIASSFFRFVYLKDFEVSYESSCDPTTTSCYIGCNNDECTETYPYKYIQKHATDIINRCGAEDIENCEAAHHCLEEDRVCEVSFCDVSSEECYVAIDPLNI